MAFPSFLDEIDRLFDQLVHDPWRRPPRRISVRQPGPGAGAPSVKDWEITVPLPPGEPGDFLIALEGERLRVSVRRRLTAAGTHGGTDVQVHQEEVTEHTFRIPDGAQVKGIEASFEGEALRVHVKLSNA
jgi:HSP20 family molecular chaperone IbpA